MFADLALDNFVIYVPIILNNIINALKMTTEKLLIFLQLICACWNSIEQCIILCALT